jgi:hypothetical protein
MALAPTEWSSRGNRAKCLTETTYTIPAFSRHRALSIPAPGLTALPFSDSIPNFVP